MSIPSCLHVCHRYHYHHPHMWDTESSKYAWTEMHAQFFDHSFLVILAVSSSHSFFFLDVLLFYQIFMQPSKKALVLSVFTLEASWPHWKWLEYQSLCCIWMKQDHVASVRIWWRHVCVMIDWQLGGLLNFNGCTVEGISFVNWVCPAECSGGLCSHI